jgi:hypothetical protein
MIEIPVWEKSNLTLEEAAAYSGIGITKQRRKLDEYIDRMHNKSTNRQTNPDLWE